MAKSKITVPKAWQNFIREYGANKQYWYIPKGRAVSADNLHLLLQVLKQFEATKPWRECQKEYIEKLKSKGLSKAETNWQEGGAPNARMIKQVFVTLGLAWIADQDFVEITDLGRAFLNSNKPHDILADQVLRYQFCNPSVKSKAHRVIKLHPVPFLLEILRNIERQKISREEYSLFVSRAKSYTEIEKTLNRIDDFRKLDNTKKELIILKCNNYKLPGERRSSMFNTIELNASYAMRFFALSDFLEIDKEKIELKLVDRRASKLRRIMNGYNKDSSYIEYANEKDWISFFGVPGGISNTNDALEYYRNRGYINAAVTVKKEAGAKGNEIKEFRNMIVSEKRIEDFLENDLSVIEKEIGVNLKLEGRQYSTTVGPIDLLAKDPQNGEYYVIELKKGKSTDKVFGQCSRYMGWVKTNLAASGAQVHGIIVAREIDEKLKSARDAHRTDVRLIEFEMKASASTV